MNLSESVWPTWHVQDKFSFHCSISIYSIRLPLTGPSLNNICLRGRWDVWCQYTSKWTKIKGIPTALVDQTDSSDHEAVEVVNLSQRQSHCQHWSILNILDMNLLSNVSALCITLGWVVEKLIKLSCQVAIGTWCICYYDESTLERRRGDILLWKKYRREKGWV